MIKDIQVKKIFTFIFRNKYSYAIGGIRTAILHNFKNLFEQGSICETGEGPIRLQLWSGYELMVRIHKVHSFVFTTPINSFLLRKYIFAYQTVSFEPIRKPLQTFVRKFKAIQTRVYIKIDICYIFCRIRNRV